MFDHELFVKINDRSEREATVEIEPLTAGYGHTIGNSLRRVLLSSLEGAAVDSVKIEGVDHEFATVAGIQEDVVEIILNLKQLRFDLQSDEATLVIEKSTKGPVTAKDFKPNSECVPTDLTQPIATMTGSGKFNMEIVVKKGRGYVPVEDKDTKSNPVGVISVDSTFSPIISASYEVTHTRVGQQTNLDKIVLEIETDGSVTPKDALAECSQILVDHLVRIGGLPEQKVEPIAVTIKTDTEPTTNEPLQPKMKIEDAGFSSRTTNALVTAGYKTISGLLRLSEIKLESIKGLGAKGLAEVKEALTRVEM